MLLGGPPGLGALTVPSRYGSTFILDGIVDWRSGIGHFTSRGRWRAAYQLRMGADIQYAAKIK